MDPCGHAMLTQHRYTCTSRNAPHTTDRLLRIARGETAVVIDLSVRRGRFENSKRGAHHSWRGVCARFATGDAVQRRGYLQRNLVGGAALWWFLWFYVAVSSFFSSTNYLG